MAKAITIKEIADQFNKLVEEGKGDYQVFLADDEEGNGYHACWYLGTLVDDLEVKERKQFYDDYNCDIELLGKDKKKAIYLG